MRYKIEYKPKYKANQIIIGKGFPLIITGWTPAKSVASYLEPQEYAGIGNLYSPTRGISFLIRNLLCNPHIRQLILLDATKQDKNAGAVECLFDFFANGYREGKTDTGRKAWVIDSEVKGFIDIEIPSEYLEQLKKSITIAYVTEKESIRKVLVHPKPSWGEAVEFPMVEAEAEVFPGVRYGHRIEGKTIAEVWVRILHRIKRTGTVRPTGYGGKWQELINLTAIVTEEPEEFYFPEPNYLPIERDFIDNYISQLLDDAPYAEGVKYTYGQRLRSWFGVDQVEQVIEKLAGEIDAASAVMSLWDVKDHDRGGSPCLNHIWVRVVSGELSLTALFRSNDMFSAWPANAMQLRSLQRHIKTELETKASIELAIGPLITISQSAHIYDDCWENADLLLRTQYPKLGLSQSYSDPAGSFVISLEADGIVVTHTTPGTGEPLHFYRGRSALKLGQTIALDIPYLQTNHALYLGEELQKAEIAWKEDKKYTQDQ